jgi:protocatechuate 4,5-dioxygenase alpha chain
MTVGRHDYENIPGTFVFDGRLAMKGYALNKMCFSFNSSDNREEFLRDPEAYCRKFHLTDAQMQAIERRNVLGLLEVGGNIYYLAKWAGIFGMNVQQLGAQQRHMTEDEFKAMLVQAGMSGCECKPARSVSAVARNLKHRAQPSREGIEPWQQ